MLTPPHPLYATRPPPRPAGLPAAKQRVVVGDKQLDALPRGSTLMAAGVRQNALAMMVARVAGG